jgi:hypothetical protein
MSGLEDRATGMSGILLYVLVIALVLTVVQMCTWSPKREVALYCKGHGYMNVVKGLGPDWYCIDSVQGESPIRVQSYEVRRWLQEGE